MWWCEVRDYVHLGSGEVFVRMQNEASNDELRRRGTPAEVQPSGQLIGDAIAWVPTPGACGAAWLELGTL